MTSDKLCQQVLHIILAGNLSFSQAENPELIALLRNAYPNVNIPNRRSVTNELNEQTSNAKEKLKDQLATVESKISLALDVWSTRTNHSFLGMFFCNVNLNVEIHFVPLSRYINILTGMTNDPGITAHYIDQLFDLYQPLLAFEAFDERHTGINLAKI